MKFLRSLAKGVVGAFANPLNAIGTGFELIGGAKQLFGRGEPGPAAQSYQSLKGAFRAADEAGLHRSLVAGSPAGYSPAPMSQAQGLLNAGSMLRAGRPSQLEKELVNAQIEEARSRTILNNANTRRALMGPQPGLGGVGTHIDPGEMPTPGLRTATQANDTRAEQSYSNPLNIDAETAEARGWEIGGAVTGIRNIVSDRRYNQDLDAASAETGIPKRELHLMVAQQGPKALEQIRDVANIRRAKEKGARRNPRTFSPTTGWRHP